MSTSSFLFALMDKYSAPYFGGADEFSLEDTDRDTEGVPTLCLCLCLQVKTHRLPQNRGPMTDFT